MEMTDLTRREFRRVYYRVNGNEPISFDRMLSVIACAGKSLQIEDVVHMWPKDTEYISIDQAYSLYIRYDAPPLPTELCKEDKEYFEGCKAADLIDCISSNYPELRDPVIAELDKFTLSNGDIDVSTLLNQIEETRKETVIALTAPTSSENSSPHLVVRQEYEPRERGSSIRGVLIIFPHLITTRYVVKIPEECKCEVTLKLLQNSNMVLEKGGIHPFMNDVFLIVLDKDDKYVAVTRHLTEEGISTGEITITNGTKFIVVSLGTRTPKKIDMERTPEPLLKGDKLTKQFKITLMNIFDFFDLDGDGLLNRDEYNDFSVASGDTKVSEEEWKQMKELVNFRDDRMTMSGFLELHQTELSSSDESATTDCWTSLLQIGFDHQMKMLNATPFTIDINCDTQPLLLPSLIRMKKEDRDRILTYFYKQGVPDLSCELEPRTFATDYFGMTIVDRIRALDNSAYKVAIEEEENVRWNFVCDKDCIRPFNFESELVLICTWVAKTPDFTVKYRIVRNDLK